MGKKKKREIRPFCFYCGDREFENLKILIEHQKLKHFKCKFCGKKLSTAGGLVIHLDDVHKETILQVPNAVDGRGSCDLEIFGMEGVPYEVVEAHRLKREEEWGRKKVKVMELVMALIDTDPDAVAEQFRKFQQQKEQQVLVGNASIRAPSQDSSDFIPISGRPAIPVPVPLPFLPGIPPVPGISTQMPMPSMPVPGISPQMSAPGMLMSNTSSITSSLNSIPGPPPKPISLPNMPPPPTFIPPQFPGLNHLILGTQIIDVGIAPPRFNPPSTESLVKILTPVVEVIKATRPFGVYEDGIVLVYGDEIECVEEKRARMYEAQ